MATVTREKLTAALNLVGRAAASRSTLTALTCIRVRVQGGALSLAATDLAVAVEASVPLTDLLPEDGWTAVVPARLFCDYIQNLGKDTVRLELLDGQLAVGSGRNAGKFSSMMPDSFPDLPWEQKADKASLTLLDPTAWAEAVKAVAHATAEGEGRPVMNGIALCPQADGAWDVVAADGFRLARCRLTPVDVREVPSGPLVVNRAACLLASLAFAGSEDPVEMARYGTGWASWSCGGVTVGGVFLDGRYPDYQAIIPPADLPAVHVDRPSLVRAVTAARLFAAQGNGSVSVMVTPNDGDMVGKLTVTGFGAEVGGGTATLDAMAESPLHFAVNGTYLLSALAALTGAEVLIRQADTDRPIRLDSAGSTVRVHVIMPMQMD